MSRFIGVMGSGRCGSSAVAGLLHVAGVPMGEQLIGAHQRWNSKGHFEDERIWRIHRLMVRDIAPHPSLMEPMQMTGDWSMSRYIHVLQHLEYRLWGVKCIFLGRLWDFVKGEYPTDRRFILLHRRWDSMLLSRMQHSGRDRRVAETAQAALLGDALKVAADETTLHVQYEQLVDNPGKHVGRILDFVSEGLHVELDREAAIAWIEPGMNHHG